MISRNWNHHLVNPHADHMSSPSGKMPRTSLDRLKSCCHGALFLSLTADPPWVWQLVSVDDSFNTSLFPSLSSWLLAQCTFVSVQIKLCDSKGLGQNSHPCLSLGWETRVMENQQLTTGCLDAWIIKRYVEKGWNQSHCTELCQSHVHLFNRSMLPLPVGQPLSQTAVTDKWTGPVLALSKGEVQRAPDVSQSRKQWIKDCYSIASLFFFYFMLNKTHVQKIVQIIRVELDEFSQTEQPI